MSNAKKWLIILLSLIALGLIGWNLAGNDTEAPVNNVLDNAQPNYQTDDSVTFVYNPVGDLAYKLVSDKIDNYTANKVTWFTNPVLTTYNEAGVPTWTVRSLKAKLTNDRVLYLYDDVQVDSLSPDSQIQRISTQNAIVNLITQDVSSDDKVTIIGQGLNSTGLKMRGNLRSRTAELIEDVKTHYVLQKEEQKNESSNKKRFIQGAVASAILALSVPAFALKTDTQQPMTINSVKQSLDLEKNVTTFTDDVIIKQGSIDIRANKVVVTRPSSDSDKITIEAFGTPVTFYQLQDDGKPIKGHALKARYEVDKELLTLTGDAYLEQLDSNIKGDKITYVVPTQQMEAFSDKGKRVTTVLLPSQLQEKGPAANNGKSK